MLGEPVALQIIVQSRASPEVYSQVKERAPFTCKFPQNPQGEWSLSTLQALGSSNPAANGQVVFWRFWQITACSKVQLVGNNSSKFLRLVKAWISQMKYPPRVLGFGTLEVCSWVLQQVNYDTSQTMIRYSYLDQFTCPETYFHT